MVYLLVSRKSSRKGLVSRNPAEAGCGLFRGIREAVVAIATFSVVRKGCAKRPPGAYDVSEHTLTIWLFS